MDKKEFATAMKYLGIAYNKEFTKEELEIYYEYLNGYSFELLKKAIKEIVKTSKFSPKVSDLIDMCEKVKKEKKYYILELMKKDNYFKTTTEFEKALRYLESGIIPDWFKKDIDKYIPKLKEQKLLN